LRGGAQGGTVDTVPSVLWFRRDLRLGDHPALLAAASDGPVTALFAFDRALWGPAGDARRAYLLRSLRALDADLRVRGGALRLAHGDPAVEVPRVAAEAGAHEVHVSADFGPYGQARDAAVEAALAADGRALVRTGSPYAVAPGRVLKGDGTPYRVYTPYQRAWVAHGWRAPARSEDADVAWASAPAEQRWPGEPELGSLDLPPAGEQAALARWDAFRSAGGLAAYAERRDRPDLAGTSALSAALRWGEVHPRTLLAELDGSRGAEVFGKELAWREFYADVLFHAPASARAALRPEMAAIAVDSGPAADERFEAWCAGRTGYPFVDAGMRQLLAEGWMHNRVRMVVASFLVKDLHLDWTRGARWFMARLRDGDLASNQQGWQWAAGTGTDAAPYFRVFNPVTQGLRFDPEGAYVRRYVPELAGLAGALAHEPWQAPGGPPEAYPARLVDHAAERDEALARYQAVKGG
jgi:deoxyribodipyrimidine photo-lyase